MVTSTVFSSVSPVNSSLNDALTFPNVTDQSSGRVKKRVTFEALPSPIFSTCPVNATLVSPWVNSVPAWGVRIVEANTAVSCATTMVPVVTWYDGSPFGAVILRVMVVTPASDVLSYNSNVLNDPEDSVKLEDSL